MFQNPHCAIVNVTEISLDSITRGGGTREASARYFGGFFRVSTFSAYRAGAARPAPHSHCESELAFRRNGLPVSHCRPRPPRPDPDRRARRTGDDRDALQALPALPARMASFRSVTFSPVSFSILAHRSRSGNRSPVSQRQTLWRWTSSSAAKSACDKGGL